jgi:hypothetical protein
MKENMIDGLTTPLAQTTPIHHNQSSLAKIIQSENLTKRSRPHKEANSERYFNLPNALPRERRTPHLVPIRRGGKHIEERAYLKNLPLGRNPTSPIHPSHILPGLIQFTVESHHHLHLPILSFSEKLNILMNFLIYNLHMLTHPSLFVPCNAKQYRKRLLQRIITTPNIMPKSDSGAITNFKSNELGKQFPPFSYMLPNSYTKWPLNLFGTPISLHTSILYLYNLPPISFPLRSITP